MTAHMIIDTALVQKVTPISAALACAVHDKDEPEIVRLTKDLPARELRALAVVLAAQVDLAGKLVRPNDIPELVVDSAAGSFMFDRIVFYTGMLMDVAPQQIRSRTHAREVVEARAVVCWVARSSLGYSFPTIGRHAERDHKSVMNLVKKVANNTRLKAIAGQVQADLGHLITEPAA